MAHLGEIKSDDSLPKHCDRNTNLKKNLLRQNLHFQNSIPPKIKKKVCMLLLAPQGTKFSVSKSFPSLML